ncbi:MAG: flagellar biosynthetic protein FlhB, partial [Planctomycetaceae bacterium]|nr:flagellar biosynthetic protein FlhB [Planctomycetaceae bacterium]
CCLAAHFLQVGFRFQVQDVLPDFSRLSLTQGFAKLWRIENVSQAGWGFVKYVAMVGLGGWYLWSNLGRLSALSECDLATGAHIIGNCFVTLAWLLAAVFLMFGLCDYGYQLWKFEQSLKMSPAELREELRNEGGSPNWKQQRRERGRQAS